LILQCESISIAISPALSLPINLVAVAWANSLFEDNAEYGLGMFSAMQHRRDRLIELVQDYVHGMELMDAPDKNTTQTELVSLLMDWLEARDEKSDKCTLLFDKLKPLFKELIPAKPDGSLLSQIWSDRDM
jgi:pyruvate-ferredoxin/flavodoxin oxidoreductase